jgi:L-amino acid N-acyltransferase YncA
MNSLKTERCGPVELRPARSADCEAIWRWNFAPDVRAQSLRSEPVPFMDHARWFARRITDADSPIWVIEEYRQAVGVIRLDPPAYGRARISIAIAESVRGRGVGRIAVATVCTRWRRPIVAEVLASNASSTACFEACGFRAFAVEAGLVTYYWDPEA